MNGYALLAIILIASQGLIWKSLPTVDPDAPKPEPPTTPPDTCSPTQGYYANTPFTKVKMDSAAPDSQDGAATPIGHAFRGAGGKYVWLKTDTGKIKIGPWKFENYTTGDCE